MIKIYIYKVTWVTIYTLSIFGRPSVLYLKHGPRAKVLREREGEKERADLNSHKTPDKTGKVLQI